VFFEIYPELTGTWKEDKRTMDIDKPKGKNFSGVNRGQRNPSDFYQTPFSMTEQLLEKEEFVGNVWEPCMGDGAILKILVDKFNDPRSDITGVMGTDISNNGLNFLEFNGETHNIITNPPFSLAFEFIEKAKEVSTRKIAMLLPLSYLHGQKRYESGIYNELKTVYVFTRYPLLSSEIRSDGMYKTGMMVYAWYIWEKGYVGKPTIEWIDNNKYVIGSRNTK
jgi:hypothetical protein